ncbi:MAG TPA: trigger factor [Methylophaga aminisulfidivorans]|jgi:trigger factor|uniref:Trigger factor n=1 Tax=Methylophaga aminisulfidivorans MP TaxID=1026882 RepID=F5T0E6_9GAMM|nr:MULTISPECIES: trigger factor [Methylophaga]EGL55267.1 FKBP-type peptidyl-prolyl cis-trans isomerase [Methylophaga aminisulfidivorans MP]WVI84054.1 trigger factor [Methylophaga thalassica]HIC48137.1 trigger factor [Methylophaga sp.]HIM41121.1 trigger factor [Methylophaga aminisulfidivorans]
MQVTVENVSELGRRMTVTVEDANIEQAVQERLKSIRPNVKMAGFRPGKVPMNMVAKTHGPSARREVIDSLVQESMREAFTQEGVNPASPPHIDSMDEKGSNFIYTLNYEVFPEVESVKLDDITLEKTVAEVTDEDVDRMLETLREQRMSWEPLKRGAKEGDGITIDFVGTIDGEEFQGGKGQDVLLELGEGRMLPEFEEQLIGKKADQEVEVTLTFPEDYRAEHLQGKEAKFAVTVKQVAKKKLPKLDKEFAELCGVEDGIAALKKEVRANMERELKSALKTLNKRKAMDSLAKNNEIALPSAPVEREAQYLVEQAKNNLRNQGVNVEGLPFNPDNFKENAEKRVKLSLLIGKIISDNEIRPEEDRVKEAIDAIAASYEDPEEVVTFYMNNQERLSEIQMTVVEDMVVEWIYDHVKVEESTSTFSDVVNAVSN